MKILYSEQSNMYISSYGAVAVTTALFLCLALAQNILIFHDSLVTDDFSTQMYYEGTKEKLKNFARNLAISNFSNQIHCERRKEK